MTPESYTAKTVLLVEDDPTAREVLSEVLRSAGYHVTTAADGRQALNYLRQNEPPACIALDLLMPVMDGWEFRAHQLADPVLVSIPVVIISAVSEAGRRSPVLRGLPAIPKPFRLDELAHVVRSLCG